MRQFTSGFGSRSRITVRACPRCKSSRVELQDKFYYVCRKCGYFFSKANVIKQPGYY